MNANAEDKVQLRVKRGHLTYWVECSPFVQGVTSSSPMCQMNFFNPVDL